VVPPTRKRSLPETAPAGPQEPELEQPDTPPEPLSQPAARYPADAAADGVTGTVHLKVFVGPRGRVEDALVVRSSGDDRLDAAAEAAVRRWRYHPARRGGRPVASLDYVDVDFYHADEDSSTSD
jgi:protein TonB